MVPGAALRQRAEIHRLCPPGPGFGARAAPVCLLPMKAVLLAGGLGTRISEESHLRPKPMIEIGGRPILWHIMKMYSAHGVNDFVVCLGCIFGVYIMHGGNISVILKALPFEIITILGGALGAFVVNNQPKVIKATMAALPMALKGSKYTKERYMELMAMLYDILQKARKEGLMAIEKDVEAPHESEIFKKYPTVGSDHHVIEFTTDYLRMMVSGNLNSHEIEALMDSEIDTHHQEAHAPVAALARLAGALPAFGIVAAVLGVVNTMGSVGQPPSVLGGMIGSALVGTFLGILLAYGVVEPLGGLVEQKTEDAAKELQCIKSTLLASMQGYNPATAIEFGRKVLFSNVRPSFSELEGHVKGKK